MRLEDIRELYLRLTFNEATILIENIRELTLPQLIERMTQLEKNTKDPGLRADVHNILWMLKKLTLSDYDRLYQSASAGRLVFPENYLLIQSELISPLEDN